MTQLDYQAVTELVYGLDREFETLRLDARRRYDLYRMEKEPYVPDDIAREGKVRMLSSLVMHSAETIRADLMMNPTEFSVYPLARESDGTISKQNEVKAENLERALATLWGRLNENRSIDRDIIWHQLVSPFGVIMLEFNDYLPPDQAEGVDDDDYVSICNDYDNNWLPWRLHCPDPLTCSWIERNSKPVVFARRYKVRIRDLEDIYTKNRASTEPDANLVFDENRFKWVSDDYNRLTASPLAGTMEVEMSFLDDGQYIYLCVQNPGNDQDNGMMLSCIPNYAGRVTGFIVPGNTTPDRLPQNRYEPFLLPLMQAVNQINDIRSMRATAARNLAGPKNYIPLDPQIVAEYVKRGEKLPTGHRWQSNNEIPYLQGEVTSMPSELSPDWDKVEERINEDMQRFLPSQSINVIDPAVLKSATATSILHAAEAGLRTYGPLMAAYDATIRDIAEAIIFSYKTYYGDPDAELPPLKLYSSGQEVAGGKNLKAGSLFKITTQNVDFPYKIVINTRSMSQAQASAQYEAKLAQWILPDGSKGPASQRDLIEAANYTDVEAQMMKLAEESMLQLIDPWIQAQVIEAVKEEIFMSDGIMLPIGQQDAMGAPQPGAAQQQGGGGAGNGQPSRLPNQAQRMDSPQVVGPQGGSSPTMPGG